MQRQTLSSQSASQSPACQQNLLQNIRNNIALAGEQGSACYSATRPPVSGLAKTPIPNIVVENFNLQNISGFSQNSSGNSVSQGEASNAPAFCQRQSDGKQHLPEVFSQTNQSESLNIHEDAHLEQLQLPMYKQLNEETIIHAYMKTSEELGRPQEQKVQEQNLLLPTQPQYSQQSLWQNSSFMPIETKSVPLSHLQQNQQSSTEQQSTQYGLKKRTRSVFRQTHQTPLTNQNKNLVPEQQSQLTLQNTSAISGRPDQLAAQQENFHNMQQKLLLQKHLCQQSNVYGVNQHENRLGFQYLNPTMQQTEVAMQGQTQKTAPFLLTHGKVSQAQSQEQQLLPNTLQEVAKLDPKSVERHTSINIFDEDVYHKVESLKSKYLPLMNKIRHNATLMLQKADSLPEQLRTDSVERVRQIKMDLDRIIMYLNEFQKLSKPREVLAIIENRIVTILTSVKHQKSLSSHSQGQPPSNLTSMRHSLPPQPKTSQAQPSEDQKKLQMKAMNLVPTVQHNSGARFQNAILSSPSKSANANQILPQQQLTNSDTELEVPVGSLWQVPTGSYQIPSIPHQLPKVDKTLSESGLNMLQPTIHSSSTALQCRQMKQKMEQQSVHTEHQNQQFRQNSMRQEENILQQRCSKFQDQEIPHRQMNELKHLNIRQQADVKIPRHQINEVLDLKAVQGMNVKPGIDLQHQSSGRLPVYHQQHLISGALQPISSPKFFQSECPQRPQYSSNIPMKTVLTPLAKSGTAFQSADTPSLSSSSTPAAPSPMQGDADKLISDVSTLSEARNEYEQTPLLLAETNNLDDIKCNDASAHTFGKSSKAEQPLQRLVKAMNSMSRKALSASVSDIASVAGTIDRIAGSILGNGSRASVGEDLGAVTKAVWQTRNATDPDDSFGAKKIKSWNLVSLASGINANCAQSDDFLESISELNGTSHTKKPRIEAKHALLEEIREINQRLVDTVVDISDEDTDRSAVSAGNEGSEGTIIKCSFSPVTINSNSKFEQPLADMSPILPLRLLVLTNYPDCSPVLLDELPLEVRQDDLSHKVKSKLDTFLRCHLQPMSLGEIATTWDQCAREVVLEYALQNGGGNFSSKYGGWENCQSPA